MNKRQKTTLRDFAIVIAVTAIAIIAMVNFKDWINRSEAMQAMEHLSQTVLDHRKKHGSVPPESYIYKIKENLKGHLRIGNFQYRARWLEFDSGPDEILAYTEKNYHSLFLDDGFIVLRLDGRVEWMKKREFKKLLAQQQSPQEIHMLQK